MSVVYIMCDHHRGVQRFLDELDLGKYWSIFKAKGYDRESDIVELDDRDMDAMHIKPNDRGKLLRAARRFRPSSEFRLLCWLEQHGLGYYYENFRLSDLNDLQQLERLDLTEQMFDELEMDVPAHRKRLHKAVTSLRKRRRMGVPLEGAVAKGHWGKLPTLKYAKNDFLCLRATLLSTKDGGGAGITLDFMVDSGSDVVTVRREILSGLDLEFIRTIKSHGVHATREKQLYRCLLKVGESVVEAEVMSESYDSIGNQVMRNFCHYIDQTAHYWLPKERPTPAPATPDPGTRTQSEAGRSPEPELENVPPELVVGVPGTSSSQPVTRQRVAAKATARSPVKSSKPR